MTAGQTTKAGPIAGVEIQLKLTRLKNRLRGLGRLAVAFSGGVDSAFLLKVAADLRPGVELLALTARGPLFPERETAAAQALAAALDVPLVLVDFPALNLAKVAANPPDRCYHCKRALLGLFRAEAGKRGFSHLLDGSNLDDVGDYRPGSRALAELGGLSPLSEAGLFKADIRGLSAEMGLSTWDKPSWACLASRFPYGQSLDLESLRRVEAAEDYLLAEGLREFRVRSHGPLARLEVGAAERGRFSDLSFQDQVRAKLRALGFALVTLDLSPFRSGSLNRLAGKE